MTDTEDVGYAVADGIAEIRLNRAPVNALSLDMVTAIVDCFEESGRDDRVRCVKLTSGLARAFSAGLDIDIVRGASGLDFRAFLKQLYIRLYDVQYALGKPTIAVVGGAARAGGMTLAVSCDIIVAGEAASFGYPEVDVGLVPAIHFVHLPHQIGRAKAFELLFLGESFDSAEALRLGLINRVVADTDLDKTAHEMAEAFAAKSAVVTRLGRDSFMRVNDANYRREIGAVVDTMCTLVETEASQEGLSAFVEKRKPNW